MPDVLRAVNDVEDFLAGQVGKLGGLICSSLRGVSSALGIIGSEAGAHLESRAAKRSVGAASDERRGAANVVHIAVSTGCGEKSYGASWTTMLLEEKCINNLV